MRPAHQRALDLASQQYGILDRAQAESAGLSRSAIGQSIENGLFVPVADGVYRMRGAPISERAAIAAATLATNGIASHMTAARLMQFGNGFAKIPLHVTAAGDRNPRLRRIAIAHDGAADHVVRTHRFNRYAEPVLSIDGIRTTDAARALFDIAPKLSLDALSMSFERARSLRLLTIDDLARRLALIGGRGRAGTPKIRAIVESAKPGTLESELEVLAWRMLSNSVLPEAQRQWWVDGPNGRRFRLDFAWPRRLVAFETEGFEWHATRARWKQDRLRTAALERLGWRIVVATWDDVKSQPHLTIDRIHAALQTHRPLYQ